MTAASSTQSFQLQTEYQPAGDQPTAIKSLVGGLGDGLLHQTLLGVTGSGKTFTIANVIQETQRPAIILAHNKTLAAQLYGEMKLESTNKCNTLSLKDLIRCQST